MNEHPQAILSFDIEEFDLPEEFGVRVDPESKLAIPASGTAAVLDVLDRTNIRATFFITGFFAENNPELVTRMISAGHEAASHGLSHSSFSESDLAASKKIIERISGKNATGFRMARLANVRKEAILEAGFKYESSLNPIWLPGRYNNIRAPLTPFREKCGLIQFPVSAVPFARIPLFWLAFKNYPFGLYAALARLTVRKTGCFNMYSHPWEYDERSASPQWRIPGYITRGAGAPMTARLEKFIEFMKNEAEFITFTEFAARRNLLP